MYKQSVLHFHWEWSLNRILIQTKYFILWISNGDKLVNQCALWWGVKIFYKANPNPEEGAVWFLNEKSWISDVVSLRDVVKFSRA